MAAPDRTLPAWLPRWDDPEWWDRYWQDVRPRLVLLRVRVDRWDLRWPVPLWAFEESLRFALLALPWIFYGRRWFPTPGRRALASAGREAAVDPGGPPWRALEALLDAHGAGMLRLDAGVPFVLVEAGDGDRLVHVEITQF